MKGQDNDATSYFSMTLRVLYVQHVGAYGGSTRSLLELITAFPEGSIRATVICPKGTAAQAFHNAGISVIPVAGVSTFDHTRMGYYRGLRWALLLREALYLPTTVYTLIRTIRSAQWDCVHINDAVSVVAGLIAYLSGIPVVWHVRAIMNDQPSYRRRLWQAIVNKCASAVIAIDQGVASSLGGIKNCVVVHNGTRKAEHDDAEARNHVRRKLFRFPDDCVVFAMVGLLQSYKGIYEFFEAAKRCIRKGVKAGFIYIGDNPRPASFYESHVGRLTKFFGLAKDNKALLRRMIDAEHLSDYVRVAGYIEDTSLIYNGIDVLCFPSHLEGVGRPVFEAGMYGKPSIVALSNAAPDVLSDSETGLRIRPIDVGALTDAITQLACDSALRRSLGHSARLLCTSTFDIAKNAHRVLDVYENVCSKSARLPRLEKREAK